MQHMMNSMSAANVSTCAENVWYVDSGASNHMTYHHNWFSEMKEPSKPGYVETGDNTIHPIEHVGDVPLTLEDGKEKYMSNVLHVPTITKNLVLVGHLRRNLQVRNLICRTLRCLDVLPMYTYQMS